MSGRASYATCSSVTPECPVAATTYGYIPSLGPNVALMVVFGICMLAQFGLGTYHRAWSFMVALGVGAFGEMVGYIGRLMQHNNVWNSNAFKIQICCLVLSPSFIAAGVYLSLKHIILYLGPEASVLKPRLYTWLFIGFDAFSIVVQAAGGGVAAAAGRNQANLLKAGNNLIVAGIAIQVATMTICGLLAALYFIRYSKMSRSGSLTSAYQSSKLAGSAPPISHWKFQVFLAVEVFAYLVILIRCIYRIPEMAGGWGNPLMQNEKEFLILDGLMMALAVVAFTVFHPGFWFPPMTSRWQHRRTGHVGSDKAASDGSEEPKLQ